MEKKTSNFSGQIGFVLAAAGSAVGVLTFLVPVLFLQSTGILS